MKIVLIGAPGSGKGTVGKNLEQDLKVPHLSVGAILREKSKTDVKLAKILACGNMVSDEITKQVVQERLSQKDCKNGFILDGYPRSLRQAEDLDDITSVDYILFLSVTQKQVLDRLTKRVTCPKCNSSYNKTLLKDSLCPICGTKMQIREDDNPESIKNRLQIFKNTIKDIKKYFGDRMIKFVCTNDPKTTYKPIKEFLEKGSK